MQNGRKPRMPRKSGTTTAKEKHTRMQQFFSLREKGKNHALVYLLQLIQFGDGV